MKKLLLLLTMIIMAQSTYAFETTVKTVSSVAVEVVFSTAIISGTSEISLFSISQAKNKEAQRIVLEVQDYIQTGHINLFLGQKLSIIQDLDKTLSTDEAIDVLINASELILSK